MRRYTTDFSLIALTALVLVQCQNPADIDFTDFTPELVIDGQLSPDNFFEISVRSTISPTSDATGQINKEVIVELWDVTEGREIRMFREDNRFLAMSELPQPGHTYEFRASAKGFEPAVARTTIPEIVELEDQEIIDFKIAQSTVTPLKKNISYRLHLDFEQPAEGSVHLKFFQRSIVNVGSITEPEYENLVLEIEPVFPEEMGFTSFINGGVLADLVTSTVDGVIDLEFREFTLDGLEELGDLIVEVRSTSQEYLEYHETLTQQLVAREDPFAEPVGVFSNVDGGHGIFASFNRKYYAITLY